MQPDPSVTAELRRTFVQLANGDRSIDRGELEEALQLRSDLFSERLFALFDHDGSGAIDIDEFCLAIDRLVVATARRRSPSPFACTTSTATD